MKAPRRQTKPTGEPRNSPECRSSSCPAHNLRRPPLRGSAGPGSPLLRAARRPRPRCAGHGAPPPPRSRRRQRGARPGEPRAERQRAGRGRERERRYREGGSARLRPAWPPASPGRRRQVGARLGPWAPAGAPLQARPLPGALGTPRRVGWVLRAHGGGSGSRGKAPCRLRQETRGGFGGFWHSAAVRAINRRTASGQRNGSFAGRDRPARTCCQAPPSKAPQTRRARPPAAPLEAQPSTPGCLISARPCARNGATQRPGEKLLEILVHGWCAGA